MSLYKRLIADADDWFYDIVTYASVLTLDDFMTHKTCLSVAGSWLYVTLQRLSGYDNGLRNLGSEALEIS